MSKRGSGKNESFWLWTGETEYEGHLLAVNGTRVLARIRRGGPWSPANGAPGIAGPIVRNERTRHLAWRIGFGESTEIRAGTLIGFRATAIQRTRDPYFEFALSGTFWPVADSHLETLSQLNSSE